MLFILVSSFAAPIIVPSNKSQLPSSLVLTVFIGLVCFSSGFDNLDFSDDDNLILTK